jgi:tetratricopeptide (TPR) repeat protein
MRVILIFTLLVFLSCEESRVVKEDSRFTECEKIIVSSPEDWDNLEEYKHLCDSLDELDRGIDFFKNLLSQAKKVPELNTILGLFYIEKMEKVSDIEKGFLSGLALDEFNKALELDSLNWSALYSRGMLYLNMPPEFANYELGLADFQKLIYIQEQADTVEPHYALTYISMGDLYMKMDKKQKAMETWQKGLKIFPSNPQLKKRIH